MSVGVGVGDIVLATTLTWRLYKSCKESSEDFRRLTNELASLYAVLGETSDYLKEHGDELDDSRKYRLTMLMDGCQSSLKELEALYNRYESLATQAQRAWDRMRFGMKDLSDIRQRLVTSTTMLTSFITGLINASTTRIEKRLNKFFMELKAGLREGSVMSDSDVASTIQSPDVWAQVRRELEDVGISEIVVEERQDFIMNWVKNALADGLLEGETFVGTDDAGMSRLTLAPTNDDERDSSCYHTAQSDLSHDSDSSGCNTVGAMSAATSAFAADVHRTGIERSVTLGPLAASSIYSLSPPTSPSFPSRTPLRRRTLGLVEKLFQKPTAIIQAASDGDFDRVKRLITMGMDVNAVDRWGWSALSMCGYGGYVAIARLLLDHGAKIDNVDVDGDTPISLAAQRGHSDVVIMLEEEEAIRKLRASEANQS
ncbi:hypothetical protein C8J57DRAFT_1347216 [Mycena rebaudengoi]|nr:hypothetical protein C8J57DRAFT_1347216 [Mycena rebaudengoi]